MDRTGRGPARVMKTIHRIILEWYVVTRKNRRLPWKQYQVQFFTHLPSPLSLLTPKPTTMKSPEIISIFSLHFPPLSPETCIFAAKLFTSIDSPPSAQPPPLLTTTHLNNLLFFLKLKGTQLLNLDAILEF